MRSIAFWRGWYVGLAMAALLLLPADAAAVAPTITSIQPSAGLTTVNWTLPPGQSVYAIEGAATPDTNQDGDFKGFFPLANRTGFVILVSSATSGSIHLPAGTNYVHVASYGNCTTPLATTCPKEVSGISQTDVPGQQPTMNARMTDRHLEAGWSLGYLDNNFIEMATSPEVYADGPDKGAFLAQDTVLVDGSLERQQQQYRSKMSFPAGNYYVHVLAFDPFGCPRLDAPTCVNQPSPVRMVTVPPSTPTLTHVGLVQDHVIVTWTVPPDMVNDFIEIAQSPDVYDSGPLKGAFRDENLVLFDNSLGERQHNWSAIVDLPPGTYYVHVSDLAPPTCPTVDAPTCIDEFSNVLTFAIAAPLPPPPPVSLPPAIVATAPPDHTAPAFASLSVRKRQHVDSLTIRAAISEAGTIAASGTVDIPNVSKVYKLKDVSATAKQGASVKLRLTLPRKALKTAKRALRRHRHVTATITITAKDMAGNIAVQTRTVTLKN